MDEQDRLREIERIEGKPSVNYEDIMWLIKQAKELRAAREKIAASSSVIEAARCIRHWHDSEPGGMVVSGAHAFALWEAIDEYDTLPEPPK